MSQQLWQGPSTESTFGCQRSNSSGGDASLLGAGVAEAVAALCRFRLTLEASFAKESILLMVRGS